MVVLVPIVIMILACSLERFEARTTHAAPPRAPRTPRPDTAGTTPAPRLALVPGLADTEQDTTPGTTPDTVTAEEPTALRRAS